MNLVLYRNITFKKPFYKSFFVHNNYSQRSGFCAGWKLAPRLPVTAAKFIKKTLLKTPVAVFTNNYCVAEASNRVSKSHLLIPAQQLFNFTYISKRNAIAHRITNGHKKTI